MQVLRETRAKIDPELLALMKDRISAAGLAGPMEKKGVFSEERVAELSVQKATPKVSAHQGASVYAAQLSKPAAPEKIAETAAAEPVDRKKVAAIVLEYMRLREEKKPGH